MTITAHFKKRLENWGRAYREHPTSGTSNLYCVIKHLQGYEPRDPQAYVAPPVDYQDARRIDSLVNKLDTIERKVVVGWYVFDYNRRGNSRFAEVWESDHDKILHTAEIKLQSLAQED